MPKPKDSRHSNRYKGNALMIGKIFAAGARAAEADQKRKLEKKHGKQYAQALIPDNTPAKKAPTSEGGGAS